MKAMRQLPTSYFSEYADEEIGVRDRSYSANWRDYGFSRFEDYLRVLDKNYTSKPNSVFECGSADGSVIRELSSRGLEVRGCEFNKGIIKSCDPDTRKRIARSNVYEVLNAIPSNSYDCVYETAAQYIPEDYLLEYFQRIHRVVKRDLVIVLHTQEDDSKPHTGQLNHWPAKKWEDLITSAGFENAFIAKNVPPFYFRKI